MGKNHKVEREIKRQSYFRLLAYAKPYWKRLTVGILCGMLVGSSLFMALLMIPQLVGVVEIDAQRHAAAAFSNERVATNLIAKQDPKLKKILEQANYIANKFHLPCSINKGVINFTWPFKCSFSAITQEGRVAWQLFFAYAVAIVFAWFIKNLAHYINGYCTRWVGMRVVADLRQKVFKRLMEQSLKFYGGNDIGNLISRCTNDISALEYSIAHCIEDLTNAPLQVLGCLAAVIVACREYNNYALLIILVCGVPLLVLPMQLLARKIRKLYRKSYAKIAEVVGRMHEAFTGILVIKSYHTEEQENIRFQQINNKYFRQMVRSMRLHILVSPTMEFFSATAALVFLLYGYNKGVTVTQLIALLAPAFMAFRPVKDISKVFASIQQSMAAADRFFELMDADTKLPEKKNAVDVTGLKSEIKLNDVVFSYDDKTIIDHVSFSLPRGKVVAVVGETGSGKTTIANLIARFYDVTGGNITIDGVDLRDCSISSLRRLVGVVNQSPFMFNDTIAANIAYGSPEATREDIEKAAKLANAHDFITDGMHSEGYDTVVGENGFKLSGGEKQRIAIARAILRNPPILILDEATSALDNVTERLVQDALNRVMANRTVFAIAHRLSTIRNADLIVVLKNGVIAESGTHDELLIRNGIYRKLHDTQFN